MASNKDNTKSVDSHARFWLSLAIPGVSILGIVVLAWVTLSRDGEAETTKYVFASILPLLGTWVGTVLAYHFAKDNFESANRSVQSMVAKVTTSQKLEATTVAAAMLPIEDVFRRQLKSEEQLQGLALIADIIEPLEKRGFNRLPIVNVNNKPLLVIHRSTVDRFLSSRAREGLDADLGALTLEDVFDRDPHLERHSFVVVGVGDTLAYAKRRMEEVEEISCLDVLVTQDGTRGSAVVGWLTNVMIARAAHA